MAGEELDIVIGILLFIACVTFLVMTGTPTYQLPTANWHCTESRVIKETLPRVEECTQYSRKEIKP